MLAFTSLLNTTLTQPPRIHPTQRIWGILVKVDPARQPYRILLGKPSAVRVIITKQIVVQSGWFGPCGASPPWGHRWSDVQICLCKFVPVQVLALHTQVLLHHRNMLAQLAQQLAPRIIDIFPSFYGLHYQSVRTLIYNYYLRSSNNYIYRR